MKRLEDGYRVARVFGRSLFFLDRYYPRYQRLRLTGLNGAWPVYMDIVTKAKKSCRAYEPPPDKKLDAGVRLKREPPTQWKDMSCCRSKHIIRIIAEKPESAITRIIKNRYKCCKSYFFFSLVGETPITFRYTCEKYEKLS